MTRRAHLAARAGAVLVLCLGGIVSTAGPAAAHGVGGAQPTNYETVTRGITPDAPGLHVRAVELGERLELRNDTAHVVTVLGYQREPYLRIGPDGVWENRRSPAVFLNRTNVPTRRAPADHYDATASPRWVHVSDRPVARWHDHRTHWTAASDPPEVRHDPGHSHVVIRGWTIPLRYEGRRLAIRGDVLWVPGPSPWPWVVGALLAAGAVILLCRTAAWRATMAGALGALIASEILHVVGAWQGSTAAVGARAFASIYSLGAIAIAVLALVWLLRRDPWAGMPAVLIAGLFVLVAGGLADLGTLTRSQLPTSLPGPLARLTVMLALGIGSGLVIAAAMRLRAPGGPDRARPAASGRLAA